MKCVPNVYQLLEGADGPPHPTRMYIFSLRQNSGYYFNTGSYQLNLWTEENIHALI